MKKSGLYSLSIGIESGSDRIRKLMQKNLSTEAIKEKMAFLSDRELEELSDSLRKLWNILGELE